MMAIVINDLAFLDSLESSFTLNLIKPLSSVDGKETFNSLVIKEPCFSQIEQFYDEQSKNGNMSAMGLLISLLSDPLIPQNIIKSMNYRDYRKAEKYLLDFLRYPPSFGGTQ
ncbi:phage tail assembly protein [Candidatus Williamhamiltonella defendens]|uniref:phage tail assembly protein n=1 Tax=Candidatus Williamhamiltonella defendens TaxID=138072 RepID=UPI001581913C|nr:phage tail assembly protein [Candidatus Hamiltonella defensa]